MKRKFCFLSLAQLLLAWASVSQPLYSEDFESYQGFGTTLAANWPLSGFKVYINHGVSGSKGCGSNFNNNHKRDSLTSPDLGAVAGEVQLKFDARLATAFIGNTATAGYVPISNDHIWLLYKADGGAWQVVREITGDFTNTSPSFTQVSANLSGGSTSSMQVKIVVSKAQSATSTDFYMDVDNFEINVLTPVKAQLDFNPSFELFPNPCSGRTNLVSANILKAGTKLEVFNRIGAKVSNAILLGGPHILDLSAQPAGIYLVKVTEGRNFFTKSLVLTE